MINNRSSMHLRKTTAYLRRWLALMLCLGMALSICSGLIAYSAPDDGQEDIRARLLRRISEEGWDPYSESMSIEEFYALMAMFEDGTLPLDSGSAARPVKHNTVARSIMSIMGLEEPGTDHPENDVAIPRTMFMFSGLSISEDENSPLEYNTDENYEPYGDWTERFHYPAGLDPYGVGYLRPPTDWPGVKLEETDSGLNAIVIVPNINDGNISVGSDVDQNLFINYEGYYVRRVTAQSVDARVLGAIKIPGQNEYVYYYLTNDDQSTDVSTTTLGAGEKFIIHYVPIEHAISYEVRRDTIDGEDITGSRARTELGSAYSGTLADVIFGADRPDKTTEAAYSFTGTAPYGYMVAFYLEKEEVGGAPVKELGFDSAGDFTAVNGGWALGMEPDYFNGSTTAATVFPNTDNGPASMTTSAIFYNNAVHHNRKVIAVLKKKADPIFFAAPLKFKTDHVSGRGTTPQPWYDFDLDYAVNVSKDESLIEKARNSGHYDDYATNREGPYPNIYTGDGWGWNSLNFNSENVAMKTMNRNADGTWSYSFTFQTNSGDDYLLDTLAVNGVSITIPFFPRDIHDTYTEGNYTKATGIGISQWFTETALPDGANLRLEHLFVFKGRNPQHIYRIIVTGARTNVTITGMNLMTYIQGAPEFSIYNLNGINSGETNAAGIEFYNGSIWKTANMATILVQQNDNTLDLNGDSDNHGANFRFKLEDGYTNPYFLWESTRNGPIDEQGSGKRDTVTGEATSWNPVQAYPASGTLDSQHIYGPDEDGYYYFRVNTWNTNTYKLALLTVVARPLRYVVRYLPTYPAANVPGIGYPDPKDEDQTKLVEERWPKSGDTFVGIVKEPENRPTFNHEPGVCDDSFARPQNGIPSEQYDDHGGAYYDPAKDTVFTIPNTVSTLPTDPNGKYQFVDWVLVNKGFEPVKDADGNELHFLNKAVTIEDIDRYAIPDEHLGDEGTDIFVFRLMPTWKKIQNPFNYQVVLRWVTAQGELNEEYFQGEWRDVLTDWEIENGALTVKVITDAKPFMDWIAQNPTYTFWDGVNNAMDTTYYDPRWDEDSDDYDPSKDPYIEDPDYEPAKDRTSPFYDPKCDRFHPDYDEEYDPRKNLASPYYGLEEGERPGNPVTVPEAKIIEAALDDYAPASIDRTGALYKGVLEAMLKKDIYDGGGDEEVNDFNRLGGYAYQVNEDNGKIVIWMYETKGGLVFHENVEKEPFIYDEEFYFTVTDVSVGDEFNRQRLNNTYKAYPEHVYDSRGNERDVLDSDAWLVTFVDGKIVNIVKNDGSPRPEEPVTYFTVKNGEGIRLYVPEGEYTIVELGSKSGGSYRTDVTYTAASDTSIKDEDRDKWDIPSGEYLKDSRKNYIPPTIDNPNFDSTKQEDPVTNPRTIKNPDYTEEVSQVTATVKFLVGARNVVQTLTFFNQTSALVIENEVLGSDAGKSTYGFSYAASIILPDGVEPLAEYDMELSADVKAEYDKALPIAGISSIALHDAGQDDTDDEPLYYYFNFNRYSVTYRSNEVRGKNDKTGTLNGTTSKPETGRILMKQDTGWVPEEHAGTTRWEAVLLLMQPEPQKLYPNDETNDEIYYDWSNAAYDNIKLKHDQRLYVVVTVPDQGDEINYEVTEAENGWGYRVMNYENPINGQIMSADLSYALFINVRDNTLTVMKKLDGTKINPDDTFEFTVKLNNNYTGFYPEDDVYGTYFSSGEATFTLKPNEALTITGIPNDVKYTVTENIKKAEGYQLKQIDAASIDSSGYVISEKEFKIEKEDAYAEGTAGYGNYVTDDSIIFTNGLALPDFPETGGAGVPALCISGVLLIAAAALLMLTTKKKA